MIYEVEHVTRYQYSAPIFLEPHVFRLRPASNGVQHLQSFSVEVSPNPAGMAETVDSEGNPELRCWFDGLATSLEVTTRSRVEVSRSDPFAFLPLGDGALPYTYADDGAPTIAVYRGFAGTEEVRRLAEMVAQQTDYRALAFLSALTTTVQARCRQVYRAEGAPMDSAQTLWRGEGSCRDLAVLFVDACRAMGFASRFVSGYFAGESQDDGELHAWAEVYVEGGGWRGFDPTGGLAVADDHIVLAAACRSQDAAPATGSFRGDATVELKTSLRIRRLEPAGMSTNA